MRRSDRKLTAAAKRVFRALAEFFCGGTEFSFSGDDSDRDALRLWRPAFAEASAGQGGRRFVVSHGAKDIALVVQMAERLPAISMNLPPIIQKYIDASNAHDVKSILACFSDDAIVRDENETRSGKSEIERWLTTTIEKYNFQFKPLSSQERDNETVVSVEIAGTFPGSPISLDYHFTIAGGKVASLTIDS